MSNNFITKHLVKKIQNEIDDKMKVTKACNFYYFNEPIKDGNRLINRVSRFNAFEKEAIIGIGWHGLSGQSLIEIYDKVKNNDFFFYKLVDGRSYKARLKKNVKAEE